MDTSLILKTHKFFREYFAENKFSIMLRSFACISLNNNKTSSHRFYFSQKICLLKGLSFSWSFTHCCLCEHFIGADIEVALMKYRFAVHDHHYLRRFVLNAKQLFHLVGNLPVCQHIKKIEVSLRQTFQALHPVQSHITDRATRTVFKNDLRLILRFCYNLFQLVFLVQMDPMHIP